MRMQQQQLSKNTRDDSWISKHLNGECFHVCTGIYEKKVTFWSQLLSIQYSKWLTGKDVTLEMVDNGPTITVCRLSQQTYVPRMRVQRTLYPSQLWSTSPAGCSSPSTCRLPWTYEILKLAHSRWLITYSTKVSTNKVMFIRDGIRSHRNFHQLGLEESKWNKWVMATQIFCKHVVQDYWTPLTCKEVPKLPWKLPSRTAGTYAIWGQMRYVVSTWWYASTLSNICKTILKPMIWWSLNQLGWTASWPLGCQTWHLWILLMGAYEKPHLWNKTANSSTANKPHLQNHSTVVMQCFTEPVLF